ncbi:NAD(P)-dependent oxidoreductase [Marine Group I thaumarchaeote]|uniref:NAD(P)-dependent oxidoreductase n=1 Tax=Marine Group I thaumarchaeote TaxID=2511932 RepID=A0A7K4P3V4_9ARCH|nr:MAG: NAD(P)-dependent oxidoreductase [Nitrosopumilus sp. YT1]NMI81541.1 NAD(P)-dependent oxidoreductase [Candidatus Nitrosopumilus sp. MTA1]NWJ19472.1 NAD(P)-dependent oxidoreductase [Marine Group I thaumarchaeote]NWJ28377.1 NAD(P)-dependent oxidoreductase [Marine Group I thaumarchaeote]NWJ56955.1 NAD(P)-dependent oxidoreductase [Marine Group I thaumarchaeote]
MKKIGIIGLGMLGNAVALHLLDLGFEVTVFNRTKEKTIQVREKGAKVMTSPKEVAENSELIITIVKDAAAVKEISFEKDGITEGKHEKLIVADMSTIDPLESKNISRKFQEHNIDKLDIPVMGGPNVAITGNLVMMVSGNKESFDCCKNVFEKIANKVFFLGESGVAHSVKLAMNLQITMLALALSEGIILMKKANVDPKIFLKILNSTYFKTGMSEKKAFKMVDSKFDATFTLSNLKKDISTITSAAKSLGIELPMIKKAEQVYENAVKEGFGEIDYTGIIEYIKKINDLR